MSALGMCSGDEFQAFCTARDISTEDAGLRLLTDIDVQTRRVSEIRVEVLLPRTFPKQYREPCLRAVSHCNVKRHLEEPLKVTVSV